MNQQLSDLYRRFENLLRIGEVSAVDFNKNLVTVKTGDIEVDDIEMPTHQGHNFLTSTPIRIGCQVLLASISGDLSQAVIIAILPSNKLPCAAATSDLDVITFNDGTQVQYDSKNKALSVDCVGEISIKGGKDIDIEASSTLSFKAASINMQGPVTQTGGDITSDGVSTQLHIHQGKNGKTSGPIK